MRLSEYLSEPTLSYWVRIRLRKRNFVLFKDIEILTKGEKEELRKMLTRIIDIAEEELKKRAYTRTQISSEIERIIINDFTYTWEWEKDDTGKIEVYCRELGIFFTEVDEEYYCVLINSAKELINSWKEELEEEKWLLNRAGIRGVIDTITEEIVFDEKKIEEIHKLEEKIMKKIDEVENRICNALQIKRNNSLVFVDYGKAVLKCDSEDFLDNLYLDSIRKEIKKELEEKGGEEK